MVLAMVLRVRWQYGSALQKARDFNRQVALAMAFMLNAASVGSFVLSGWRLGADLQLTGEFAISRGIFSHWQVWLALGAAFQIVAITLNRYAHREDFSSDDV